ncbi:MAG TPA: hypothetical protein VFT55_07015, partial [Planctomycetota bacterium]|nr:hypothetical protein [Planctomycetota bacterium]
DVLLHAQHAALRVAKATVWGVLPFGVLFMNQFLLRTCVVAFVLALGWTTSGFWWPGPERRTAAPPGATPVVAAIEAVATADAAAMRNEVPPGPAADAAVVFLGRCFDASTGKPMSGVNAGAWWLAPITTKVLNEYDVTEAAAHALTDTEGRFRLPCALRVGSRIQVRVWREDLLLRLSVFGPYPGPQEVDLGELHMHTGVRVETRVVDQRGQPVGGVAVSMTLDPNAGHWRTELLKEHHAYGVRSAADGSITWPGALVPGRYKVRWYEDSIPPERSSSEIFIPADRASLENELVCPIEDERHSIRGVVVDDAGHPAGGLWLSGEGAGTRGHCRSSWDGRFVMPRIGPYDENLLGPVTLSVRNAADGYELVDATPCQWGCQDLRLVVRTVQHLVVRAIDPRISEPLRECTIVCAALWPEHDGAPLVAQPRTTTLADGAVQLGIARVPHLVQVLPSDPALAPSALLRWEPGTTDEIKVDLLPTKASDVFVVAANGEPVRGSEVWTAQLIEGGAEARGTTLQDVPLPTQYAFGLDAKTRWERYGIDDAPLDHGTTDATGRVRLRVPTHLPALIAAFGPGHVPRAVVMPTDGERIELRVQRGASIRFELSPPELVRRFSPSDRDQQIGANREAGGQPQRLHVSASRARHEQDPQHRQRTVWRSVTGSSSTCDGLVPGTYDLAIYGHLPSDLGNIQLHDRFATVALLDGEERIVPLDLSPWALGRVRGQVLVNGTPWAFRAGSLRARSLEGTDLFTSVEVATDANGRFEAEMVSGPARFHLRSQFDHSTWWCAVERCSVVAGATTEVVFDVRRIAARVRVVTSADQPAPGLRVVMQCADEPGDRRSWTTDEDGCFTIDPAPLFSFKLSVGRQDRADTPGDAPAEEPREALLGPVQVSLQGTATEFTLRLPKGWR